MTVERGKSCAVLGRSGSGKSTLLHLLAGLQEPSTGSILIDGDPLTGLSKRQRERMWLSRIGLVFQHGELLPELTVFDNVALPLRVLGKWGTEGTERCLGLLNMLGISELRNRFLGEVSGGQLQRAAVARAVVHRPAVILADEPTGSLDEQSARDVLDLLLEASREEGAAMIVATHDQDVASSCDAVYELSDGLLIHR